jgi:antitoxin MazE
MKSRIVQIGNSRGIRLPKVLLEEAQLADEVELEAEPGRIVIRKGNRPRAGWAAAARRMRERDEDRLLDPTTPHILTRRNGSGGRICSGSPG